MSEYINRDDFIKLLQTEWKDIEYREMPIGFTILGIIKELKKFPAADVVERELYERALSDVVELSVAKTSARR